ncbi:hypothetical protein UlMin_009529 [Ulmus minor]
MAGRIASQQFLRSLTGISNPNSILCKRNNLFDSVRNLRPIRNLGFLQISLFSLRFSSNSSDQRSFAVSYLVNSLGFSSEMALSASRYLHFETPDKPDKVIKFFDEHGFTRTQISNLVRRFPGVLSCNQEKSILPKLEFFRSKGLSDPEMAKILSVYPSILRRSVAKHIIPSYEFFMCLFQSDEKLIRAFKRDPEILLANITKNVVPNVDLLKELGLPKSYIATFFLYRAKTFISSSVRFREIVEEVKEMGFNVSQRNFLLAMSVFRAMKKSTWEKKVGVFMKWGWSEEDVYKAFKRNPWCMMASEEKIVAYMDFFTNKMGWKAELLAKRPAFLTLSLKKRVIPRALVFEVLLSKGLVKKDLSPRKLFDTTEKKFLQTFVLRYEKEAPELLKLYKKKLALSKGPETKQV